MEMGDAALVALAKAGDPHAFRALVERHSQKMFRLAFRLTGNETDAEDVVQESFLKAYRNLAGFDDRAAFNTWLYRIASNQALDLLRARQVRRAQSLSGDESAVGEPAQIAGDDPSPERLAFSSQIQARVAQAMEELSPQERTAFTLRHYEGQTIEEISGCLKINNNAAKHSIFRAVQKLRRALEPAGGKAAWRT